MTNHRIAKLATAGLLIAIGIIIPMFSPIKIVLEPASFTLASHVAIFIAMFISPGLAAAVAVGITFGFYFGGFPIIIVIRAASHVIFAFLGATYLHKLSNGNISAVKLRLFSLIVGLIHALCEVIVVSVFYFGGNISAAFLEKGFFMSAIMLVGLGSVIHSMVDFEIARLIVLPLKKQKNLSLTII